MSVSQSDLDSFHHFASQALPQRDLGVSMEELLNEWRARQEDAETRASIRRGVEDVEAGRVRDLADVRAKIRDAKASSSRGDSAELDIEQVVREVIDELAAEGIRD